jgi:4,5-dihydroxyphthalate decarboxylase
VTDATSETVRLRTVLGNYPHTMPLKSGVVADPAVRLDFVEVEPVHRAFAAMVRRQEYDLCEMAIVTCLQAIAYGKPVVLLPAVIASRLQRGCIIYYRPRGVVGAQSLAAARIGVRAYTQTTGMWVRAALAEDYGLPIEKMRWVTSDPAHVEEYVDPPIVEHVATGESLPDMLRTGAIDAAILGNDLPDDPDMLPVIPNHRQVDEAWRAHHGFIPINHMVVVTARLAREQPDAVRAAYRLLTRADALARSSGDGSGRTMFGFARLRQPLQVTLDACYRQLLLPRRLAVDEIFETSAAILGDIAA